MPYKTQYKKNRRRRRRIEKTTLELWRALDREMRFFFL